MPIFRKGRQNILFVHVPKAGGTTIERMFASDRHEVLYRDAKTGPGTVNRLRRCSPQHMHASALQRLFKLEEFDFIFMITREPLARFRSEYGMRNKQHVKADAAEVDQWAEKAFAEYSRNSFVYDNHLRPQAEYYIPGSIVYRLEDGMESIVADLNGRLESPLSSDIPRALDRKEASGVASSDVEVSRGLERRLRVFYHDDYARFGYESWTQGAGSEPCAGDS